MPTEPKDISKPLKPGKKDHRGEGGGQPRKYPDPKVFGQKIVEYFQQCKPYNIDGPWPNVYRLCLHLGLKSEQSLYNYQGYGDTYLEWVTRARLELRACNRDKLDNRETSQGAIFIEKSVYGLSEGFSGGLDQQSAQLTGEEIQLVKAIASELNRIQSQRTNTLPTGRLSPIEGQIVDNVPLEANNEDCSAV